MNATVDGDNLLAAILSQSDDATARLAYADWLEEESRGNLASPLMIRAGMIRGRKYSKIVGGWRTIFPDLGDFVVQYGLEVWIDGDRWRYADAIRPPILDDTVAVKIVRGFVAEVLCTQEAWMAYGREIARTHPVQRAVLSDCQPISSTFGGPTNDVTCWLWFDAEPREGSPSHLGPRLYACLQGGYRRKHCAEFANLLEAVDALSNACIAFARRSSP